MDLRKLKTLIDLVSESNISELEITEAEGKVRIVKAALPALAAPAPAAAPGAAEVSRAALAAAAAADLAEESGPVCKIIKSPMVGTFYRASGPSAKPFIELGDSIKQGEPVCIIEAMKIMNEIEADCDGKVVRILCENGQAVEFGQPLFSVE
jgi:acetyl-CoA carboxylase biotin carboxyl carrier protein